MATTLDDLEPVDHVRLYQQERLLLEIQETIAAAIYASGLSRAAVARRLGVSRAFITQCLSSGKNLTLKTVADLLWATGHAVQWVPIKMLDP